MCTVASYFNTTNSVDLSIGQKGGEKGKKGKKRAKKGKSQNETTQTFTLTTPEHGVFLNKNHNFQVSSLRPPPLDFFSLAQCNDILNCKFVTSVFVKMGALEQHISKLLRQVPHHEHSPFFNHSFCKQPPSYVIGT